MLRASIALVLASASIVVACASAPPPPASAKPKPKCDKIGEMLIYTRPGCGDDADGLCAPIPPPCYGVFCGCDGKTHAGFCMASSAPFRSEGPCLGERDPQLPPTP